MECFACANRCIQRRTNRRLWLARVDRGACDWELNRRAGHEYQLLPPEAAINPSEDAVSIDAAIAMRVTFPTARRKCGLSSRRWWTY